MSYKMSHSRVALNFSMRSFTSQPVQASSERIYKSNTVLRTIQVKHAVVITLHGEIKAQPGGSFLLKSVSPLEIALRLDEGIGDNVVSFCSWYAFAVSVVGK